MATTARRVTFWFRDEERLKLDEIAEMTGQSKAEILRILILRYYGRCINITRAKRKALNMTGQKVG